MFYVLGVGMVHPPCTRTLHVSWNHTYASTYQLLKNKIHAQTHTHRVLRVEDEN